MGEFLKPIRAIHHSFGKDSPCDENFPKLTDSKVKWVVLEKIGRAILSMDAAEKSALHPTAIGPGLVMSLLSAFIQPERALVAFQRRTPVKPFFSQKEVGKYIPVGLRRCMPHGWINAFMQLLLFLPRFAGLLSFLPRSLETLREFADHYYSDQRENLPVSSANSAELVRCLIKKLSRYLFRIPGWVDLYAVFLGICELLSFHYESKLVWDVSSGMSLSQLAQKKLEAKPLELLVCVRGMQTHSCHLVQRQFFTSPDWLCYDMDAFIEYRPDGHHQAEFIAYIKSEGTWYQCDDERIAVLRSSGLSAPLHRAVLLHYRQIPLIKRPAPHNI